MREKTVNRLGILELVKQGRTLTRLTGKGWGKRDSKRANTRRGKPKFGKGGKRYLGHGRREKRKLPLLRPAGAKRKVLEPG